MQNIAVSNDTYNNALAYAKRHNTNINVIVESFLKNINDHKERVMQRSKMSPFQMQLLDMASRVHSEDEKNEIRNMLAQYFADKAEKGIDQLWEDGVLNDEVIESWRNENMHVHKKQ